MLKVVVSNARAEQAAYYLEGIGNNWQDYSISFAQMNLTDWKFIKDIAFVVEAWNTKDPAGTVLVDNISFSN